MPGGALTYNRPGGQGRPVASPAVSTFGRPTIAPKAPGNSAPSGNMTLQPPKAGPNQPSTKPPEEYTDTLGNVFRWNAGGFTGNPTQGATGLTPGGWVNIGNANRPGAGSTPEPDDDFDFEAALNRIRGALPQGPPPANLPERIPHPSEPDRRRAESLEFGRAKDRIGKLGQGAMKALRMEMQTRGIAGSDYAGDRGARIVAQQQGDLGNVVTEQALSALARDQHATDRDYSGDLGQRSTDVGFSSTTRGQDMDFEIAKANAQRDLLQLLASTRRRSRIY